ncbi:MAG: 4-(cytidine 5'-diphospho)-2-C-methyl-D-erythritol kinase [Gammaproteobacteria bacterium RBG_16_57_12]|nr:MAG: 4-(cytidine 5'-diphospho)-2-C-methyl-D-erythritol kinase [Gammaproteobacteria bacterium RBG_16_57_12]
MNSTRHPALSDNWPSPAKLNLFLHITGRRPDGYHLLQTLFQFIDYCDELGFSVRPDGQINCLTALPGVPVEANLVVRAARRLQAFCGTPLGVDITLTKRIPLGGGLGGGSSNAATTLVALNQLWGLSLSPQRLAALGLELGADVPIFVYGHAAWAEGVGEQLTPVDPPEPWYVVICPPCQVSTAGIFAAPELTRDCKHMKISGFLTGEHINVCTPVVAGRYPEVAEALAWLARFAPSRMTGTGACIFAGFGDEPTAREVLKQLPERWQGFVAKGMNISPLLLKQRALAHSV